MSAMKITLLGTGSPLPTLKRASSSYLVETGAAVILASDARLRFTGANRIFRGAGLARGLEVDHGCARVVR